MGCPWRRDPREANCADCKQVDPGDGKWSFWNVKIPKNFDWVPALKDDQRADSLTQRGSSQGGIGHFLIIFDFLFDKTGNLKMKWPKSEMKIKNESRLGQWANIRPPQLKNPGDATASNPSSCSSYSSTVVARGIPSLINSFMYMY